MLHKYRAWDKKNKKWIGNGSLDYLCVCEDVVVLVQYVPSCGGYAPKLVRQLTNAETDNLEIVAWTGRHDKNLKEIYEGDIIKVPYGLMVVKDFIRDSYFIGKLQEKWTLTDELICRELEVIGNTYENPELLEG